MTAEVAAGGADKDGGNTGQQTLSLNRMEDFRYPQQGLGAGLGGMAGVFT